MQMQEDLKRQLQSGEMGEVNVESLMESKQQMMLDSLWKLNVADIELTISHVCQTVCSCILSLKMQFVVIDF
jgi:hypothetical protein